MRAAKETWSESIHLVCLQDTEDWVRGGLDVFNANEMVLIP